MSGSAKAGTTAERHKCELRILASTMVRAPPKRASGELCFPLTKTYMDVGYSEGIGKGFVSDAQSGKPIRLRRLLKRLSERKGAKSSLILRVIRSGKRATYS